MAMEQDGRGEWRAHWPTVAASAVGMSFSTIYIYSSGAFVAPLEQEFGWSRTAISSGLTLATVVAALLGPAIGAAVDKFGSRRLALPGIVLFCVIFAMLSLTTKAIWTWWALWFLAGLAGLGVKPTIWTTAVAGLFTKSRGLALACTLCGTALGSTFAPLLAVGLGDAYGWRSAFIGIALAWGLIGFPIIYLFFNDARTKQARGSMAPMAPRIGLSIRGSVLSWRFLALAVAATLFALMALSLVASLIPILSSQGIARKSAAGIAATIGITSIIGRLTTGFLLDRLEPRFVTSFVMALPVISLGLLLAAPGSIPLATTATLLMGLSLGAEVDAIAFLTGHYFGMKHYGLLFAVIISCTTVSTGAAPLLAGFIYDRTGAYETLLLAGLPMAVIASLLVLLMGRAPTFGGHEAAVEPTG